MKIQMSSALSLLAVSFSTHVYAQSPEPTVEVALTVLKEKKHVMPDGKKISVMEVAPPNLNNLPASTETVAPTTPRPVSPVAQPTAGLPGQFLQLVSRTYDGRFSKLEWTHEGERYEAWSNLDFNLLNGFTSFESKGKNVTFMHMCSSIKTETTTGIPDGLPQWLKNFPLASEKTRLKVTKGDKKNRAAMHAIRTLHELYAQEHSVLVETAGLRKEYNDARKAEREAKKGEPIQVFYWKK